MNHNDTTDTTRGFVVSVVSLWFNFVVVQFCIPITLTEIFWNLPFSWRCFVAGFFLPAICVRILGWLSPLS